MNLNLGTKLKELREDTELSQDITAKKIGISQSSLARYELGKTEPKATDIILICNYYKITPNELLDFEETKNYTKHNTYNNNGIHNGNVNFK